MPFGYVGAAVAGVALSSAMGSGGSDVPQAPASVGQNSEEMAKVAREQLQFNKDQYAEFAPYLKNILQQQTDIGTMSADNAKQQWQHYQDTYLPIENQMAKEAMAEGSTSQQESEANQARADVASQYEAGRSSQERDLALRGINPASPASTSADRTSRTSQAASEAGAMNMARTNARMRGIALRSGAAQFGRNMPQTGIASDALALNAGSSAVNTGTASMAAANAGVNASLPWYTGAGNLALGAYDASMKGYQAKATQSAGMWQGLGTLGGMAAYGYMLSSKTLKTRTGKVDPEKVLAKVVSLPVDRWRYKKGVADEGEHIGTYAEDFQDRFGVGDGKVISIVDAVGVTMAAVQGLAKKIDRIADADKPAARVARMGVAHA